MNEKKAKALVALLTIALLLSVSCKKDNIKPDPDIALNSEQTIDSTEAIDTTEAINSPTNITINFEHPKDTSKWYGYIDVSATQNFPPFQDILNLADPSKPVYGLFTWSSTWNTFRKFANSADIADVGWRVIRIGCDFSTMFKDENMVNLADFCDKNDAEVMFTLISLQRFNYGEFLNEENDSVFIEDFIKYFDDMVNRFGPNGTFFSENPDVPYRPVLHWEIWNEPNLYYLPGPEHWEELNTEQRADLYGRLLVKVYNHVRANPDWDDIKIVGIGGCRGGLNRNGSITSFTELVHEKIEERGYNPANCYDIVSTHPYIFDGPPDADYVLEDNFYQYSIPNNTAEIRRVMDLYGNQNKPIWFTEVGWHRFEGAADPSIRGFPISERLQAAYAVRLYLIAMRIGVERVHDMFVWDANSLNAGFFNNDDGAWWEQTYAVETLIEIMPNPRITSAVSDGVDGYYCYVFTPDVNTAEEDVIVAWNVEGPVTVEIPLSSGKYKIVDMLGEETTINNNSNSVIIEIGPCPIYIVKI